MSDLLEVKKLIKSKKPKIRRVEKHRRKSLPDNWRKPKGHHSKVRRRERPQVKMPLLGRRAPSKLRGFDKLGREIIRINTIKDVSLLNEKNVGIVSKKLGLKKKTEIAKMVKGMNLNFINFKAEEVLKKAQEKLKPKKKKEKKIIKKAEIKKVETKPIKKPAKPTKKPIKKPAKPKKGETK